MGRPDFFIVGAAKCGTTALYTYLRQHPAVFMPDVKEPHRFGQDLNHASLYRKEAAYLALFDGAKAGQRVGEASPSYLRSVDAAKEIAAYSPDARIIIMLRDPVDALRSLHAHFQHFGTERCPDLQEALDASDRGESDAPPYRAYLQYATQVERYLAHMGPERVLVLRFDELKTDAQALFGKVCRFLAIDDAFQPTIGVVNARRDVKATWLTRLASPRTARKMRQSRFPPLRWLGQAAAWPWVRAAAGKMRRIGSRPAAPLAPLDPAWVAKLRLELADEIRRLEQLTQLDLRAWREP